MKPGAENRRKTIAAGVLGTMALLCLIYIYNQFFGGTTPAPVPARQAATTASPAPTGTARPASGTSTGTARQAAASANAQGTGAIAGVGAQLLATASSGLDPTLDQAAMLRTESLVYAGAGRNIFSATYTAPVAAIPVQKFPPRPTQQVVAPPPVAQVPQTCPPSCPPINLKFFGTAQHGGGDARQAFLLQGEDVYLASAGDIVARKYKIVSINATSLQVTDLQNNNTQTLTLQTQ